MKDTFNAKAEDFTNWCCTALEHYQKGYHADALINMRKSGEAACKLMFLYRFHEKTAEEKTAGKSYKELIQQVMWQGIAPRKVITWLEALQVHGNDAAHDTRIEKDHARFGMDALCLLAQWMFTEYIKAAMPSRLVKSIALLHEVQNENTRQLEQQLHKAKKEKEELEKKLSSQAEKKSEETETISRLASELDKMKTQVHELEREKQKEEIKIPAAQTVQAFPTVEISTRESKKKITGKRLMLAAAVFAGTAILFFLFKNPFTHTNDAGKQAPSTSTVSSASDTFRVLIFPLSVMQDNPNLTLKFEEAMESRISQRIREKKLPIYVFFEKNFIKPAVSQDEAAAQGLKHNANMVLFGELYEPLGNDSVQVNIKFTLTREKIRTGFESGIRSFLRLSDSASIRIQMGAACWVDLAYSEHLMLNNKFSEALAVLYDATPVTPLQKASVHDFLAQCHFSKQSYDAAIKELDKMIALQPDSAYPYAFMANVLKAKGNYKEAEKQYMKSLRIAIKTTTLSSYANLLSKSGNYPMAKEVMLKAVKMDTANSEYWRLLGEIEFEMNNFKEAKNNYRKAIALNSANKMARAELAEALIQLGEGTEAEKHLSQLLKQDSSNTDALLLMGHLYTFTIKKPAQAQYLYLKYKQRQPLEFYTLKYAEGVAAFEKGDYAKTTQLLSQAYRMDSSDMKLCNRLATAYTQLGDNDKAYYYALRGWEKDTMDFINNDNLGYLHYYTKKYYDRKKAIYYFEKALKTNPYDTICLEHLSTVYFSGEEINKAKALMFRLTALSPHNLIALKGLAGIYELEGDFKKGSEYYKAALNISPEDAYDNAHLAFCLMKQTEKNYSIAIKYIEKAMVIDPNNANNLYIYAQMFIVKKDYYKAQEYYQRAIAINPALRNAVIEEELNKFIH